MISQDVDFSLYIYYTIFFDICQAPTKPFLWFLPYSSIIPYFLTFVNPPDQEKLTNSPTFLWGTDYLRLRLRRLLRAVLKPIPDVPTSALPTSPIILDASPVLGSCGAGCGAGFGVSFGATFL